MAGGAAAFAGPGSIAGVERKAGSIDLIVGSRALPFVCSAIVGKVVSPIADPGVLQCQPSFPSRPTHSNPAMLPIMSTRDDTAPAPGSGVNRLVPGALESGLICRRLEKLGTSEAELRGMGPGDMVGWREVRCDDVRNMLGGSGNTVSAGGAEPVVSISLNTMSITHRHHTTQ